MKEERFIPVAPQFKGDGVAVWTAKDKNNKTYLKIKLVGHSAVLAFKNEPKLKEDVI